MYARPVHPDIHRALAQKSKPQPPLYDDDMEYWDKKWALDFHPWPMTPGWALPSGIGWAQRLPHHLPYHTETYSSPSPLYIPPSKTGFIKPGKPGWGASGWNFGHDAWVPYDAYGGLQNWYPGPTYLEEV